MNPAQHYASALSVDIRTLSQAAVFLCSDGAWSILSWDESILGPEPSNDALATVIAMPEPPAPEPVIFLYRADLYRRCTDDEADAIDAELAKQPTRLRRIFESAVTFRSDDDLWSTLHAAAVKLFGDKRAAELLAASA